MVVNSCTIDDIPVLARLNEMLIEDEKAETLLGLAQLEKRMAGFLKSGYRAFLFCVEEKPVGYALCDLEREPVYLRQFFICWGERRKGYGKQAFQALLNYLHIGEIDIDVYVWNEQGVAFWESLGFEKRCYNMRFKRTIPT